MILKEKLIVMQLSSVVCPTCENVIEGRNKKREGQRWKPNLIWQVSTDKGIIYYHQFHYMPITEAGKEDMEYMMLRTGQEPVEKIEDETTEDEKLAQIRQMNKPNLLTKLFKNRKANSMPEEIEEESDDLDSNWPMVAEIENALEHPEYSIEDNKLKKIKMENDVIGLLLQTQGQFAVVYKGKLQNSMFALRLFKEKKKGLMQRYSTLHNYLVKNKIFGKCSYFTEFEYKPQSISIKVIVNRKAEKVKCPIVKMDWVKGVVLQDFIQKNNDPKKIRILADEFLAMVNKLEDLKIAHGDLHPKNIMVHNEQLKLVDYDCIFIKDFKDQPSPENGDPDCQHPNRNKFTYDYKIDRFSALVIYLGLLAISEDIELRSHRVEEFIFSQNDFLKPKESKLFKKLDGMSSKIKSLSSKLQEYCNETKPNVNSLQEILDS